MTTPKVTNKNGIQGDKPRISELDGGNIRVLLTGGSETESSRIKYFLQRHKDPAFIVNCCPGPQEAIKELKEVHTDVILLDFEIIDPPSAKELFKRIRDAAGDTPVVIFIGESKHAVELMAMQEGAAGRLTRERFMARPESLSDAIEFSLARSKALKTGTRSLLKDNSATTPTELRLAKEESTAALQEAKKMWDAELAALRAKHSAELKEMQAEKLADIEAHKQIISWMSGEYSVHKDG